MLDEGGLHLEGADPVARGDDKVVLAGEEPEVSVLVLHAPVPGKVIISTERIGCGNRILTISLKMLSLSDVIGPSEDENLINWFSS